MDFSDRIIIGIDTGGTFTDFIYLKDGLWGVYKILSTPDDPSRAVLEGIRHISGGSVGDVVHGSTVATNAILERKGVRTAIITNHGFEDIIEIGRQNRAELYNLFYCKPENIVPRELRLGISGRVDSSGREISPLDLSNLSAILEIIRSSRVESVAVCFLFSYLNPSHEKQIYEKLRHLDLHVSLSHNILAEFREFERLSTTVVNAYVSPKMSGYLKKIKDFVLPGSLRIMQSNGGSISADAAMDESVRTILSGPAGGVVGAMELGRAAGYDKLVTFDMGGTSTDVCLIDRSPLLSTEAVISGYPLGVPMLDIHTVGAGGGSIATIDGGGSLRVGPESAGADPGPVCYGKGGKITVTDANLFLGRMVAERFLGGDMILDQSRLKNAFEEMSVAAGLKPLDLAQGILSVANTNMERAIRVISVERGFDPREFTLLSFGGAGGMHCAFLAAMLSIPRVLIPKNPGVLSAMGMVMADIIRDYSRTVMLSENNLSQKRLDILFEPMEKQALEEMKQEMYGSGEAVLERFLDMRYKGQSFEIMVPFSPDLKKGFEDLHWQKYGYKNSGQEIEVVNIRLRAVSSPIRPKPDLVAPGGEKPEADAYLVPAEVFFEGQSIETTLLDRDRLRAGNRFQGPAIVVEYTSTIVVPPFAGGSVDGFGNIIIEI
jgi:N-methylhydantoinase A